MLVNFHINDFKLFYKGIMMMYTNTTIKQLSSNETKKRHDKSYVPQL